MNVIETESRKLSNINLDDVAPNSIVLGDLDLIGWVILKTIYGLSKIDVTHNPILKLTNLQK